MRELENNSNHSLSVSIPRYEGGQVEGRLLFTLRQKLMHKFKKVEKNVLGPAMKDSPLLCHCYEFKVEGEKNNIKFDI